MNINFHFTSALFLRLLLIAFGCIQDAVSDVKYTDIDYLVFTDAANYVSKGLSPFKRHTYRYTPLLAYLLLPNKWTSDFYGKICFSVFDIFASMLIYNIQRRWGFADDICRLSSFMWLYNPLPIVISTRGNAESIMTLLILLSIYFHQGGRPFMLGVVYGLSIHFKIYPCIYVLSFYFTYSSSHRYLSGWKKLKRLLYPSKIKVTFALSTISAFSILTLMSYILYGDEYIEEALLYHVIRKDIRHNFSPYFYLLYLSEVLDPKLGRFISLAALIIQGFLILLVSWVFTAPHMLPACMFLQTFIFVTFNKVCTSQYFVWYLCLFPLTFPLLQVSLKKMFWSTIIWCLGQGMWLIPAYYLEFKGENNYLWISFAGLLFFAINVSIICLFIKNLSIYVKFKNK